MSVGAGSLKRTAKSVSTSKTDNVQNTEAVEVKRQTPAKQAEPKKAAVKTTGKKAAAAREHFSHSAWGAAGEGSFSCAHLVSNSMLRSPGVM